MSNTKMYQIHDQILMLELGLHVTIKATQEANYSEAGTSDMGQAYGDVQLKSTSFTNHS